MVTGQSSRPQDGVSELQNDTEMKDDTAESENNNKSFDETSQPEVAQEA